MEGVHDWWRRTLSRELTRLRREGWPAVLWSLRITVAATASYVVARFALPGTQPLLAPLTAMLVVQVTPVSLLASGRDRVLAVVAGVVVAVAFASVVPLAWWSLAVLIVVALLIGQLLRLGSNQVEVAISGMLVLGVGTLGAGSAAWQRFSETLVGAAVGVVANLLFPPKVASGSAASAIDGLADSVGGLLNDAADELTERAGEPDRRDIAAAARGWLGEARQITHDIPQVGAALLRAEESRRLNVRAVGTPHVEAGLRQGLEALEHSSVSIRGLFRALADATYEAAWLDDDGAADVLLGLAETFRGLAAGIDAFGQLVRDEAQPTSRVSEADVRTVRESLRGLQEARARLEGLVAAGGDTQLLELHAATLSTVGRLLGEMDLDARVRRQVRLMHRPRTQLRRLHRPGPAGTRPEPRPPEPSPEEETQVLPPQPWGRRHRPGNRHPDA
jgi:hypothetical protein